MQGAPLKLYGFPRTRAYRVRWALEEAGAPYAFVTVEVTKGAHRAAEHLARNPHGKVPVLEDGELRMIESCAMVLHIADRFPEAGLAPKLGTPERARYYQWTVHAGATLDEPLIATYFHTALLPPERRDPAVVQRHASSCATCLDVLESALEHDDYLAGAFSAADVAVGYAVHLADQAGLLAERPRLAAYMRRLSSRPAFARTYA
jgi:glutathione S-transferase